MQMNLNYAILAYHRMTDLLLFHLMSYYLLRPASLHPLDDEMPCELHCGPCGCVYVFDSGAGSGATSRSGFFHCVRWLGDHYATSFSASNAQRTCSLLHSSSTARVSHRQQCTATSMVFFAPFLNSPLKSRKVFFTQKHHISR